jgi:ATP-dependent protease ClpP protease subunit
VKIIKQMTGIIYINGIIGEDYKVSDALLDLQKNKMNDQITLKIGSDGGFIDVAEEIFWLFKNSGKITRAENIGNVASAAVKLFLLAPKENRYFDGTKGVFLIHNPYNMPTDDGGDSDYHQRLATELGKLEKGLVSFYASATGSDPEIIQGFMKINTPLTEDQITSLGFASSLILEFQAVASINNLNFEHMTENDKNWLQTTIANLFKSNSKILNLMVADANGKALDFGAQIETVDQIKVGMTVKNEDGTSPIGEVVLPNGLTLVLDEKGIILEIKEAAADEAAKEIEALKKTIADLQAQVESEKAAAVTSEAAFNAKLEKLPETITSQVLALYAEREEKQKNEEIKNRFI